MMLSATQAQTLGLDTMQNKKISGYRGIFAHIKNLNAAAANHNMTSMGHNLSEVNPSDESSVSSSSQLTMDTSNSHDDSMHPFSSKEEQLSEYVDKSNSVRNAQAETFQPLETCSPCHCSAMSVMEE